MPNCSIYAAKFKFQGLFMADPCASPYLGQIEALMPQILILTVGPSAFVNRRNLVAISPASASVLCIAIAEAAFAQMFLMAT